VAIGLTTDAYLRAHPKPLGRRIRSYARRHAALKRFLARRYPGRSWRVVPLEDRWGGSVASGPELLVASTESRAGAESVNRERRRRGLPPLALRLIPTVRAADGAPIASRRIRAGEIDVEGRRRAPITLGLSRAGARRAPFVRALRTVWGGVPVRIVPVVGWSDETSTRAAARARSAAVRARGSREVGVAVSGPRDRRTSFGAVVAVARGDGATGVARVRFSAGAPETAERWRSAFRRALADEPGAPRRSVRRNLQARRSARGSDGDVPSGHLP
jgi:pantetheine-phosphate adenylyltransferase